MKKKININWVKENKIKSIFIFVIVIFVGWLLTKDWQEELPYRVTGSELLEIKEECKNLAEEKVKYWNDSGIGTHQLMGHGYSEFGGFCYAEILQDFGDKSLLLYNSTQEKDVFRRAWPKDINWYEKNFDWFVLGKSRIIDFRGGF